MSSYQLAKDLLLRYAPPKALRVQSPNDWRGDFPLPPALTDYFAQLGPVDLWISAYGNPYFLPSLTELWSYQVGYRIHGTTGERLHDWEDDWLVIADEGGDPFIFSRGDGRILHAYHGEGVWEPSPIFENLPEMVTALAIIGDVVFSAGAALTDEDAIILPAYRAEVRKRISDFLRSPVKGEAIVRRLGWN